MNRIEEGSRALEIICMRNFHIPYECTEIATDGDMKSATAP
jgi:hypothetical protein